MDAVAVLVRTRADELVARLAAIFRVGEPKSPAVRLREFDRVTGEAMRFVDLLRRTAAEVERKVEEVAERRGRFATQFAAR